MDDKRLNEIMEQYVAGKSRGQEVDFSKLEKNQEKAIKKNKQYKLAFSVISIVLVIAIALAITLPLALRSEHPSIQYFELQSVNQTSVDADTNLDSSYGISATMPTIEYLAKQLYVLESIENSKVVGAYIKLDVFDEQFDKVTAYIIPTSNSLDALDSYELLPQSASWDDTDVKYSIEYNDLEGNYKAQSFFTLGEYKYYLDATYYLELDIQGLLELIF